MVVVLLVAAAVTVLGTVLYAAAGRHVTRKAQEAEGPIDRTLARVSRRTTRLFFALCVAAGFFVQFVPPAPPAAFRVGAAYAAPLLAGLLAVLGASHVEIRGRGLRTSVLRFGRFNVFTEYLLVGQRVPWFSAALAAPADLSQGGDLLPAILPHLAAAAVLAWGLRILLVRFAGVRPLPDGRLAVAVRAAAREAGIRLRGVLLVPTEPGQSVNAVAATSSRYIFVAQGLVEGLRRDEVRAVLLHEAGHLGQRVTNLFRSLSTLMWPAFVWCAFALQTLPADTVVAPVPRVLEIALILAAWGWWALGRALEAGAERRADEFAVKQGDPRALSAALRKIYAYASPERAEQRRGHRSSLGDRLRRIGG
jgi:Zn-dependent protease with chaperone function